MPVVGAWDADDHLYGCGTGETRAIPRALSMLNVDSVAPLMQWSLVCQLPASRSVKSCCVIPVHGTGVTVEAGTDSPAGPRLQSCRPFGSGGPRSSISDLLSEAESTNIYFILPLSSACQMGKHPPRIWTR